MKALNEVRRSLVRGNALTCM